MLTAKIYTDPRLLAVQGAVEALPAFDGSDPKRDDKLSVGTGTEGSVNLSTSGHSSGNSVRFVHSESQTGNAGELAESNPDRQTELERIKF